MSYLHTESGYGQVIATEYGGMDQSELRSWTFDKVEGSENQYVLVHQSPKGMGDASYPVENAPENVVEQIERNENVEIVERENPIWSAECSECGWSGGAEAERGTSIVERDCPMCEEVTEWKIGRFYQDKRNSGGLRSEN